MVFSSSSWFWFSESATFLKGGEKQKEVFELCDNNLSSKFAANFRKNINDSESFPVTNVASPIYAFTLPASSHANLVTVGTASSDSRVVDFCRSPEVVKGIFGLSLVLSERSEVIRTSWKPDVTLHLSRPRLASKELVLH